MFKHFIDLEDISKYDLQQILKFALEVKKYPLKYDRIMRQKSLGMIFEKQSLRTRVSFDIAMKKIGGNVVELESKSIGFGNREIDSDFIKVLSQYLDCLVIRNDEHKKIKKLANLNKMSIINGLSDFSHPCQILSDIFTIEELKGDISNLQITWCGDINNVCISLLQAARIFNFRLILSSPERILIEKKDLLQRYKLNSINFVSNPFNAVTEADCVMTDVWTSMDEKKSNEKINLMQDYQVNKELMNKTKDNTVFMHCLPAHRNQEVTDEVIDGKKSIVWLQARNRMYVQQGILNFCIT